MKLENLQILENSTDYDANDTDEIMLSIGWMSDELYKQRQGRDWAWSHWDVDRSYDYTAIAKLDGKVIGSLQAMCDRDNFDKSFLYSIIVHKDFQRKGVAKALMKAFDSKFSHTKVFRIAPVKNGKIEAEKFLNFCGFKQEKEKKICAKFKYYKYDKTSENKESKIANLEILENCANFNLNDIKEIRATIGSKSQNIALLDELRNVDYYAVAKIGEKAVGILTAFCDRDRAFTGYLYSVEVHKEYQRQGIGRALMRAYNRYFGDKIMTFAAVPTKNGDENIKFLSNFGFVERAEFFAPFCREK